MLNKVLFYGPVVGGIQTFHDGPSFDKFLDALECIYTRFGKRGVLCRGVTNEGIVVENEGVPVARIVLA